jgi:hypothetical protein
MLGWMGMEREWMSEALEDVAGAETFLSRCARPRPRLVCEDGQVVADEVRRTEILAMLKERGDEQ